MRCLECHDPMTGRAGRKFCSDLCRSRFHNHRRAEQYLWDHGQEIDLKTGSKTANGRNGNYFTSLDTLSE